MEETMKFYLPWPPAELSPNSRVYWRKKNPIKAAYRDQCYYLALPKRGEIHQGLVKATFIFYPPDNRARDLDNILASCKPLGDGVCQALGINDKHLRPITLDWGVTKRGGEIELILEPYRIDISV